MASTPAVITTAPPTKVRRKASLRARMTSLPGRRIRPSRAPGGDGGIRTLDRALQPYNGLANRRLQPLGHISATRRDSRRPDMPDARAHCKTRAQPRGYRALWAEQNVARLFVRGEVGLSPAGNVDDPCASSPRPNRRTPRGSPEACS